MKPDTLLCIKQDIKKLLSCVEVILLAWPSNQLTMVRVLLQNASFVSTHGYSHEENCERLNTLIKAIRAVADYNENNHVINWIAEEASMIYEGNSMAELEEEAEALKWNYAEWDTEANNYQSDTEV